MRNILTPALQETYLDGLQQSDEIFHTGHNSPVVKRYLFLANFCRYLPWGVWGASVLIYLGQILNGVEPMGGALIFMLLAWGVSWLIWRTLGKKWERDAQQTVDMSYKLTGFQWLTWWKMVADVLDRNEKGFLIVEEVDDIPFDGRALIQNGVMGSVTPFVANGEVWLVDHNGDLVTTTSDHFVSAND